MVGTELVISDLMDCIQAICICVVLPVMIVWLVMRKRINETNRTTEVILAAIERKENIDIDALTKSLSRTKKTPREKLQATLTYGCVFSCLAVAGAILIAYLRTTYGPGNSDEMFIGLIVAVLAALGIAFMILYFAGKKALEKNRN